MDKVKHPMWQCPGCKTVIHHAGMPSHANDCKDYLPAKVKYLAKGRK